MSGTPEYYFAKRWHGIEKLGKLIGDNQPNSKRSSIELSITEEIGDIIAVIEIFLHFSGVVKNALFEQKLSENDLLNEISVLDDRVKWAVNVLQDASAEINSELNRILVSNKNLQVDRLFENISKDQKN
jgi:hypothetical protein